MNRYHSLPVRAAIHECQPGARQWHFSDKQTTPRRWLAHALMVAFSAWILTMLGLWFWQLLNVGTGQ